MYCLAAWLHTLDPFAFRISGDFGVRWYGLSYVLGFVIAYVVLRALSKRGLILIPFDRVGDAMLWLIAGTVIGGRLGYCVFYQPKLFAGYTTSFPFWDVLRLDQGGMASHGAMIGLILACWRVSRGWTDDAGRVGGRSPVLHVMDAAVLVAPFGVFLGRIANFINGELLGAVVTRLGVSGPWWTVQFPQELLGRTRDIPALQSPETAARLEALVARVEPERSFEEGLYRLATHASSYAEELRPLLSSRHPSQIYQAVAEGLVVGLVLWLVWRRPRKPGVVVAWFFVTYGVLRVVTEFWRLPDAHFAEGRPLGLSRGQWFSLPMVVGGVLLMVWASTRQSAKLGGWGKGAPPSAT